LTSKVIERRQFFREIEGQSELLKQKISGKQTEKLQKEEMVRKLREQVEAKRKEKLEKLNHI